MIIKKYIDFIKAYLYASRWLFKKYSLKEQIASIRVGGGTEFMNYLINYPQVIENYESIVKRLKVERKKRKLRVCFLVSEAAKWNMQFLYEELLCNDEFYPFIVVTNVKKSENWPSYQHLLDYYRTVAENVEVGWDEDYKQCIDLKQFSPDVVFYQQPWYIYPNQDVSYVSSFALTCYVSYAIEDPYIVARGHLLNFYFLLSKYFVLNETYKAYFLSLCPFKISNIVSLDGHPKLDVYADYHPHNYIHKYVIYAPHHSIANNTLRYGTFKWSGEFLLEWAKTHPEIDWVFKPHPHLKLSLVEEGVFSQSELDEYINEWQELGIVYEDGNYFDLFKESRCMITDCGSFLTEYLPTQMPVIHLCNSDSKEFSPTNAIIMKSYYKAFDIEELSIILDEVVLKQNDPLKSDRIAVMERVGLKRFHASAIITKELNKLLS